MDQPIDVSETLAKHTTWYLGIGTVNGKKVFGIICNCITGTFDANGRIAIMPGHEKCCSNIIVVLGHLED